MVIHKLNQKGFTPLILLLMVVVVLAVVGVAYYFGSQKNNTQTVSIPRTVVTPSPIASADPTTNWKTYKGETAYTQDGSSSFTIDYPTNWQLDGSTLLPLGPSSDKSLQTSIILGGGGRGAQPAQGQIKYAQGQKEYPAGKADYYYSTEATGKFVDGFITFAKGNIAYIFYLNRLPVEDLPTWEKMLATFKITNSVIKAPADSQTPAAGACGGPISDQIVVVSFAQDNVPNPRCTKVTSDQKLKIVNNSNQPLQGIVGSQTINVGVGKTQTLDAAFGTYLETGVHRIVGAEIWLQ